MNALYRPGPLDSGMIDIYIERQAWAEGSQIRASETGKNPWRNIRCYRFPGAGLADRQFSGRLFSMGKADILRKAMGKKQAELMAEQKKEFLEGCEKHHIDAKIADCRI